MAQKHTHPDDQLVRPPLESLPRVSSGLEGALANLPQGAPGQGLGLMGQGLGQGPQGQGLGGDQGGGFLSSLLGILKDPRLRKGIGAFGAGFVGQGPQFLQRQQQKEQSELDREFEERKETRLSGIAEEALLASQQVRKDKDRAAAIERATEVASLPNSAYDDVAPNDQQFVSPTVFRALKNRAAIARIADVDKLGGVLARNPEAPLPKSLQGVFSPGEVTIAREIGKALKETRDLSIREIRAKIIDSLSQPLSAGQVTEITDPVTGERTRTEQVPFQPRQETAQQAEINFREEIAERFEKGEISKDMLNFLAGGRFGNSTKEELDIISLASVMAEVRGIKSDAGILEDIRTIVTAVDPELAKRIPEMFVESEGLVFDDTRLRIPGESEAEKPKVRKVGDEIDADGRPAVITAIDDDGNITVEFE